MKTYQTLATSIVRRLCGGLRACVAPAGIYAWVLSALLVASTASRADDLDIYTKAKEISSGANEPMVAMVTDTSVDMVCSLLQANCKGLTTPAPTILNERSAGMKDALRAVMTSGPSNLRVVLLDYAEVPTANNDNGRVVHEMARVGEQKGPDVVSGTTTFSGSVDVRVAAGAHDATQTASGAIRLGDNGLSIPVKQAVSPYFGVIEGSWTSSGGAGLSGTAADGIEDAITDNTKWQNAPSNGNKVYYYRHTNTVDLTQTFTLDATGATTNPVLFFIDYAGPAAPYVMYKNDDRGFSWDCSTIPPAGTYALVEPVVTDPAKCKKGSTIKNATKIVTLGSTISATLVANRWYKIVVATRDAGKADTFKLTMQNTSKGTFWDSESYIASEEQTSGFHFPNIVIPQDADIISAKLVFARTGASLLPPQVRPAIDENMTPADFSATTINARSYKEDDPVSLDILAANPEIDFTELVKEHVHDDDWCPGNALSLAVKPVGGVLDKWITVKSYETNPADAPRLQITYAAGSGDPAACVGTRSVSMKIQAMSEDVNQFADGTMDINKDLMPSGATDATIADKRGKLWLSSNNKVGLRFTLAQIPRNAKIVSAKLKLTAKGTASAQTIKVAGILDKSGNAQAFFADPSHLDSLKLTGTVSWTPPAWIDNTVYEIPDLADLVQQQVNAVGWESENTLGFVLQGTAPSVMKACAWEYGPGGGFASTNPADFGGCAASLELEIDDEGRPVTTTYRKSLVDALMGLKKTGRQPMGGAYLKTAEYLAGWFNTMSGDTIADHGSVDTGSPVKPVLAEGQCASNTIVFISDVNEGAQYPGPFASEYNTFSSALGETPISCGTSGSGTNQSSLNCNRALATMMFEGFTPVGASAESVVKTYTFNFNATAGGAGGGGGEVDLTVSDSGGGNLRSIAESGGGAFKQSGSSAQLVKQLLTVLRSLADSGASVAAPGISVNALNRFEHLDQLYYSLFKPSTTVDWTGNLKRYQLKESNVADVYGHVAVDLANNAFFKSGSRSFWSPGDGTSEAAAPPDYSSSDGDGGTVTIGGAAQKTVASERRIFTYLDANSDLDDTELTDQITLAADGDDVTEYSLGIDRLANYLVDGTDLGSQVQVDARRSQIIEFLRATPHEDTTVLWPASIHNSPRIVSFKNSTTSPVITVFYGDNRGFLHAIDAGGLTSDISATNVAMSLDTNPAGKELFAFVPQELLKNAAFFHENTRKVTSEGYIYGMDGDITLLREDANFDGNLDRVVLFAGMRRGGSNYYALDVSKARSDVAVAERTPVLKWVIEGGVGAYAELGETWSAMSPNRIFWNGERKNVLVFGGGHDSSRHDDGKYGLDGSKFAATPYAFSTPGAPEKGAALFIADPETGELIWKSTMVTGTALDKPQFVALKEMKYSIVATPRLFDRNGDGAYDGIYVVDLAGQVFRFDLNKDASNTTDPSIDATYIVKRVTRVAALGGTSGASPVADNRRFYDSPSVAYIGSDVLLALSSGYREEPTSKTTQESFFFLKDKGAFAAVPPSNPVITPADMDNITANAVDDPADMTKPGWYFNFDKSLGEKGIGSPVIFNTAILWSTYLVEDKGECVPDIGSTRLYLVDFRGQGLADSNGEDAGGVQSRYTDIDLPGLADTPQIIFREGGGIDVAVGVRVRDGLGLCIPGGAGGVNACPFDTSAFGKLRRSRWYMVDDD